VALVVNQPLHSFVTFIESGEVTDPMAFGDGGRPCPGSGWTSEEVRAWSPRPTAIDVVGVTRLPLLRWTASKFLKDQSRSYFPVLSMSTYAVQALRRTPSSPISVGCVSSPPPAFQAALPTDFRLAEPAAPTTASRTSAPNGKMGEGGSQCTSLAVLGMSSCRLHQAKQMELTLWLKSGCTPAPASCPHALHPRAPSAALVIEAGFLGRFDCAQPGIPGLF